jgi:hypothetical protein
VLDVPVSFFYEEMAGRPRGLAEAPASFERDPMTKRETLELVRSFSRIGDGVMRRRIFELVKAVARSMGD